MIRQQQYVECSKTKIKNKEADENVLENGKEKDAKVEKEEMLTKECVEQSKFERRKEGEDDDDDGNNEEGDDRVTDIEEEIDLEAEQRIKGISYNNLLKQLYQESNPVIGLLGEPSERSFDYYVLYRTPTRKKRVPRSEKYGSPLVIMLPPTG
ncbi:hypothetical protein Adt_31589 [Abeliophyllum distichum]|uniref:Uncharacterized protein n=1 Tax=Abeliophyllum distichum TaxID=126358 RepID=A0ABD1RGB4_9LAMI